MKIIFAGTPAFAVPTLQLIINSAHQLCAVYTQPDRAAGRGLKLTLSPIKSLALSANIPVFQPQSLKTEEVLQQLASFNADLIVVIAYGMILPQSILDIPKLGCINIHGSLLPRWRGAAPIHRALMAGDNKTGITVMKMIKKLDAGAMLHKEECLIEAENTSSELHDKLANLSAIGLNKVLAQIETDTLLAETQDESLATYAAKLKKSESVLDWQLSAIELDRKIRGLNAWPVAQTLYQGKVLRIWKAKVSDQHSHLPTGSVIQKNQGMRVVTGQGMLDLLEVQLPGRKRVDIQAFMNAHPVEGIKLG